jgi:Ino eighty subunit 1
VQFDLLHHIFNDRQKVFTPQALTEESKVHFCDLYVNALYMSHKCSKVLKDKMAETPAFAVELAKFALLTNVGRINTTMACKSAPAFVP